MSSRSTLSSGSLMDYFTDSKEVDGIVYEVDCAMITVKDGDVDIGTLPLLH